MSSKFLLVLVFQIITIAYCYAQISYIINATDFFDYNVNDTLWVRYDEAVVQKEPVFNADIIGVLYKNDKLFVKSKDVVRGYINISTQDITDGWINKDLIRGKVVAIPVTYGKSIDYYNAQISESPVTHHYALYLLRALAKKQAGDTVGAISDLTISIQLQPMFYSYAHRAILKLNTQEYESAIFDLDEAIDLCPNDFRDFKTTPIDFDRADLLYFRGLCKIGNGAIKGGCDDFAKAKELGFEKATEMIQRNCN